MADIFEILEPGLSLIVYADDILLYTLGDDPDRTLTKLQNGIGRLTQWCTAHQLSVSPEKCVAIDFSRRRNSSFTLNILGQEIEWCPTVKILGVWFGRSLLFKHHFSYLRAKAFKRLNYIKAIAAGARGVGSAHMITIVNSLIRSLLEYACPLFLTTCPSSINSLEVIYNAAIRTATGLPKSTPIPVLRREAGASSLSSRFRFLTHSFFMRILSMPRNIFSDHPSSSTPGHLSTGVEELLTLYNIDPQHILQFTWPVSCLPPPNLQIVTNGLAFQNLLLPSGAVVQAWRDFRSQTNYTAIIASDASKDEDKTAIAIYNESNNSGTALLIPQANSIFTAEALGLYTALSMHANSGGNFMFLTDSLSTLKALQNVSLRSPMIILRLHNLLHNLLQNASTVISLVWSAGHKGIPPNEVADDLARNGPYLTFSLNWVAPEDLKTQIRKNWVTEQLYAWTNSDYSLNFPHLTDDHNFRKWTANRREDVWIALWRTRMWYTNYRLYKIKRAASPMCMLCCVTDTPEHALLHCIRFSAARTRLLSSLGFASPPSYTEVISSALRSRKGVIALTRFSAAVACS